MSASASANAPIEGSTPLRRGAACLPCRKRKMKCDGNQPVCGQCASKGREEDCEYTTAPGLTKTQMLEESIALLEARIRVLENPEEGGPVKLHDPNAPVASKTRLGQPHGLSNALSSGSWSIPALNAGSSSAIAGLLTEQNKLDLINALRPHASQVGLFIYLPRFLAAAHSVITPGSLLEALVQAVYLWGSHFSTDSVLSSRESDLLSQAVQSISSSLFVSTAGQRGQDIVYGIQAEVLLANYYFTNGRFLEGRYHASAAVSLVFSCSLNLLHSDQTQHFSAEGGSAMIPVGDTRNATLADPADFIEEGERINAFWSVYALDKAWAVALDYPSAIAEDGLRGVQIHTPWPRTMDAYEKGALAGVYSNNTIQAFLAGFDAPPATGHASFALRAQATVLFSRSSWLASQCNEASPNKAALQNECFALGDLVTRFINSLTVDSQNHDDILVSMLAHVALIQLHINFLNTNTRSIEACVASAKTTIVVLRDVRASQLRFFDPIMAILLTTVGQVFIREFVRNRGQSSMSSRRGTDACLNDLASGITRVLAIMTDFGTVCPLMAMQAIQLQHTFQLTT